jgi:hypothetical protein
VGSERRSTVRADEANAEQMRAEIVRLRRALREIKGLRTIFSVEYAKAIANAALSDR